MLQIASGKLFRGKPVHRNELRGVLYTNLRMYNQVVDTAAGRLLYTSTLHDSKSLVYEFTELIEDDPAAGGILSHGIDPYLSDFAAVVSFTLNVTCTPDPDLTSRLLSGRPGPSVQYPPSRLVERIFDDMVFCQPADEAHLFEMVGQLISLERRSFLAAMRAIRSYVTGLPTITSWPTRYWWFPSNHWSRSSTTSSQNGKIMTRKKRPIVDQALIGADESLATRVREALLKTEHVALTRRFREFALDHLRPSYFREEAQGLINPMGRSDLVRALNRAYHLRSKYIHELAEMPGILTVAGRRDTVSPPFERGVILTFQGLGPIGTACDYNVHPEATQG